MRRASLHKSATPHGVGSKPGGHFSFKSYGPPMGVPYMGPHAITTSLSRTRAQATVMFCRRPYRAFSRWPWSLPFSVADRIASSGAGQVHSYTLSKTVAGLICQTKAEMELCYWQGVLYDNWHRSKTNFSLHTYLIAMRVSWFRISRTNIRNDKFPG